MPHVVVYGIAVELFTSNTPDTGRILLLAGLALLALVLRAVFNGASTHVAHVTAYAVLADLRRSLARKLDRIPLARVHSRTQGELKKTLHDDVEKLEEGLAHGVPDIASAASVPLVSAVILFVIDWRLALAIVGTLPVVFLTLGVGMASAKQNEVAEKAALTRLNTSVVAYLRGMRVIRGFLREDTGFSDVRDAVEQSRRAADLPITNGRWSVSFGMAALSLPVVVLVPLSTVLYLNDAVDLPTIVLFLLLGMGFNQPFFRLIGTAAALYWSVTLAGRSIAEVLDEPELTVPDEPVTPDSYEISVDGVTFGYGETPVLTDVSLRVAEGSFTAIVGPTGAGKSTLAKLVARFADVSQGAVRIGGVDVRNMDPAELMRRVALVQQDDYLFDDTVLANIRLGRPDATEEEVIDAARRARVHDFAEELPEGFRTRLGAGGGRLSGGQRQRISVARAILKNAPVVILDEATAYLDPDNEEAVNAAVTELARGRTVIVVAHRLSSVTHADSIVVMDHGRVSGVGTHDHLRATNPLYAEMWAAYQSTHGWTLIGGDSGGEGDGDGEDGAAPYGTATVSASATVSTTVGTGGGTAAANGVAAPPQVSSRTAPAAGGVTPNLDTLGFLRQWFTLLGDGREVLLRRGLPRMVLEGSLRGAPVWVVFLTLSGLMTGVITETAAWIGAGVLLALLVLRAVALAAVNKVVWGTAHRSVADIQLSVVDRMRRVPLGFFGRYDTGRLSTLMTSDVPMLDFQNTPSMLIGAMVQPVIAATALFSVDWRLALAVFAGLPVFLLMAAWSDRVYKRVMADVSEVRSSTASALLEHVRGTAVLRAYPDAPQARHYLSWVERLRKASVAMSVRATPASAIGAAALELGFVALVLVGSWLYTAGLVSPVTLLLFLVISLVFYAPIQEINDLSGYRRMQQQITRRIAEVWDAPVLSEPAQPRTAADGSVEFRNVSFDYEPGRRTLDGVDFTAEAGKVTALVGPSGAGKSTVANLVARFWDVAEGAVLVGGADVRELGSAGVTAAVTTVYQDVYLFPDTVRNNVALGRPEATDEELRAALAAAQCDFVDELPDGLDTMLGDGGADLSGGQRQRLSIARALLKDTPVIVLDEAVASVDPATEARIQRAMSRLARGRTVIVIAHRLNTVKDADRIVVIDGGRVDGAGTHDELLAGSPAYRRLWQAHERAGSGV